MPSPREIWHRISGSDAFGALPEWLREPPVSWIAATVVGVLLLTLLIAVARRLATGDPGRREARREARRLRRLGDYQALGQLYESLDRSSDALAAYRRGALHAEAVDLLARLGKRQEAKAEARDHQIWVAYGELCREDGEHLAAGEAFEAAGKLYDAAQAFEAAGEDLAAARAYIAVGMEANAARLLHRHEGAEAAEVLDAAVRAALCDRKGSDLSPDMVAAVRRAVQLWLAADQARRAWRLALDSERWEIAAPIARDYLEAEPEMVEVCRRAGDHLGAAEICRRLGDTRGEALERAEHHLQRGDSEAAARCFETAEAWGQAADAWAAAGEAQRAAELYAQAEDYDLAARLYEELGDDASRQRMHAAARERDPVGRLEAEDATRQLRKQRPAAVPALGTTAPERYSLGEEIGRGGMGVVLRAWDSVLEREVAFKRLADEVTGTVADSAALLQEARAAARLSHPNIVQVYDAGRTAEGEFFIVMELVEGETFSALLKERSLSIAGAVVVGRQICSALDHAHQRRFVHRDLKPSNLLWTKENQVKLTDFGLARAFEETLGKVETRAAGTPSYMAPEQIRGEAVDPRADLYALGCVLYELLCRQPPFGGGGSSIHQHLSRRPDDPRGHRPQIPDRLADLVLQCLEKDPDLRPATAAEVARRLQEPGD